MRAIALLLLPLSACHGDARTRAGLEGLPALTLAVLDGPANVLPGQVSALRVSVTRANDAERTLRAVTIGIDPAVSGVTLTGQLDLDASEGTLSLAVDFAAVPGEYNITLVARSGDVAAPATFTFNVRPATDAPTLTGVWPSTGLVAGGTTLTLTGSRFVDGATVTLDTRDDAGTLRAVDCATPRVSEATVLTCVTPAHDPGVVAVTVHNPDDLLATLPSGFTFKQPTSLAFNTAYNPLDLGLLHEDVIYNFTLYNGSPRTSAPITIDVRHPFNTWSALAPSGGDCVSGVTTLGYNDTCTVRLLFAADAASNIFAHDATITASEPDYEPAVQVARAGVQHVWVESGRWGSLYVDGPSGMTGPCNQSGEYYRQLIANTPAGVEAQFKHYAPDDAACGSGKKSYKFWYSNYPDPPFAIRECGSSGPWYSGSGALGDICLPDSNGEEVHRSISSPEAQACDVNATHIVRTFVCD